MELKQYLKEHGVTGEDFGRRVGISAASVTRISKGEQNISLSLARDIVTATGGKVTLEDLAVARVA